MEATELVMQCARANQKKQHKHKPILFSQIWEYGTTPTNNVQGQLKLKWACLIKHLADAELPKCKDPNARVSAKAKIHSNLSLLEGIGHFIENSDS
jgi:hypothetical protein